MSKRNNKYKWLSVISLITIQVLTAIAYKLSQQGGGYQYSTASSLVVSELFKLCLSLVMVVLRQVPKGSFSIPGVVRVIYNELTWIPKVCNGKSYSLQPITIIDLQKRSETSIDSEDTLTEERINQFKRTPVLFFRILLLALFYCINNNAYFIVYHMADPASITLLKSTSTLMSAIFTYCLLSRTLGQHQWLCILLQMCGLIGMQWDPCKQTTLYPVVVYMALGVMVGFSAFCSVWNEMVLKKYPTCSIHVQNVILYFLGVCFNLVIFSIEPWIQTYFIPTPGQAGLVTNFNIETMTTVFTQTWGRFTNFFDHYNHGVFLIIACNSLVGLAVTGVYKYGDAITKNMANSVIAVVLLIVSVLFFGLEMNVATTAASVVVIIANYLYFSVPLPKPRLLPVSSQDTVGMKKARC